MTDRGDSAQSLYDQLDDKYVCLAYVEGEERKRQR